MTTAMVALAAALTMLTVVLLLQRQDKIRRAVRAAYFDAVAPLFTERQQILAPTGFPRLSGQHRGHVFDLQVIPDSLSYRKLPALWLLVTLPEPLALRGTLDILLRPMGNETFSQINDLPVQIDPPAGFPTECIIRCDTPAGLPDLDLIALHLGRLDWDGLKELVISPKGLRIVWLAEEANRSRYLLFRDAEMGQHPLAAQRLQPLLAALRDLSLALNNAKD